MAKKRTTKKTYRFACDVDCDGLCFEAGESIVEGDLAAGRLGPMLRTGWIEECEPAKTATQDKETEE